MDLLSDALSTIDAHAFRVGSVDASGSWGVWISAARRIDCIAVVRGEAELVAPPLPPRRLGPGDVFAVVADQAYTVRSDARAALVDIHNHNDTTGELFVTMGAEDHTTRLTGCQIGVSTGAGELLLDVLPGVIVIPAAAPGAASLRALTEAMCAEVQQARTGTDFALARLGQLVILHVLRSWLDTGPVTSGWLQAMQSPELAPALRAMHEEPSRDWRVAELARCCAMSRTTFACRFKEVAGEPPRTYLRNWRMHLARRRLTLGDEPVGAIGLDLGYRSESAFSTAFKQVTGTSPRGYRSHHQRSEG